MRAAVPRRDPKGGWELAKTRFWHPQRRTKTAFDRVCPPLGCKSFFWREWFSFASESNVQCPRVQSYAGGRHGGRRSRHRPVPAGYVRLRPGIVAYCRIECFYAERFHTGNAKGTNGAIFGTPDRCEGWCQRPGFVRDADEERRGRSRFSGNARMRRRDACFRMPLPFEFARERIWMCAEPSVNCAPRDAVSSRSLCLYKSVLDMRATRECKRSGRFAWFKPSFARRTSYGGQPSRGGF